MVLLSILVFERRAKVRVKIGVMSSVQFVGLVGQTFPIRRIDESQTNCMILLLIASVKSFINIRIAKNQ